MAVQEKSPEVYKPRQGKVSANFNKFDQIHVDFIVEYAYKYLRMFGYYDTFLQNGATPMTGEVKKQLEKENPDIDDFVARFNQE